MTTVRQDSEFKDAIVPSSLLEEAIEWIKSNMEPEDVFNDDDLKTWAEDSGYTKEVSE